MQLPDRRPEIVYPCPWSYQVIGLDEQGLRAAVAVLLAGRTYSLLVSKKSRTGKYTSFGLELVVVDEADRNALFEALAAIAGVTFVL
jgi:uncharacterized protein